MRLEKPNDESAQPLVGRRRFLGWIGALGSSLYVSGLNAQARVFYSSKAVEGIPQKWVDQKGKDVLLYANYIKGLRLRNITPKMVLEPHFKTRGRTGNTLPPRHMWRNIAPTLRVLDEMSSRMKAPIGELLSIYRSPKYNAAVRGKSRSWHMKNVAVDVRFSGVSSWTVSKYARKLRSAGRFKGGVGHYSSFTHVDTRGQNVDW